MQLPAAKRPSCWPLVTQSALVAEWLKPLLAEGYQARDIAIFARTEAVLRERAEPALQLCGLRGRALRMLLYIFEADEAVRLFRAA